MLLLDDILKRAKSAYRIGKHPNSHRRGFGSGSLIASSGAQDAPGDLQAARRAYRKGGMVAAGKELDRRHTQDSAEMEKLFNTKGTHYGMTYAEALKMSAKLPSTHLTITPARRRQNAQHIRDMIESQRQAVGGTLGAEKKAHIIMGLPGAGKSQLANRIIKAQKALLIDADEFKPKLDGFRNGLGANAVHEESSAMASAMKAAVMRTGTNFIIPLVGREQSSLVSKMKKLKDAGYHVTVHHVDVPNSFAQKRVVQRFLATGRAVGTDYVKRVGNSTRANYDALKKWKLADSYAAYSAHDIPGAPIRYALLGTHGRKKK